VRNMVNDLNSGLAPGRDVPPVGAPREQAPSGQRPSAVRLINSDTGLSALRGPPVDTIGAVIRHHGQLQSDRPAVFATQRIPISWRELAVYADVVRADLRSGGFGRDARIGVALPNGPEAALAIVAIACSAVAVPFDLKLTLPEIELRLRLLRLDAVVVLRGSPSAMRTAAERAKLPVVEAKIRSPERLEATLIVPKAEAAAPSNEPGPEAPAFILQTSGTTGQPKLIPYSHSNMLAAARRVQSWFTLTADDRCLSATPIYYCHGLTVTVFDSLLSGGSIAFPRDGLTVDIDEWFGTLQPTWFTAGPTLHRFVMEKAAQRGNVRSLHRLRFVVSGGAPLPSDVRHGLEAALGVPVLEHYGATEAAQVSANLPPPGAAKAGTCGIPEKGSLIIAREDGRELPRGHEGEIWIRGPTLISGYLDAPELNSAAFVGEWFRTGDLGRLDEEGYLVLHGRKKEIINRGGEKISPTEIDAAMQRHPDVVEAAAYAVPHPRLGEDVAADVVLRPGSAVSELELRNFLCGHLAVHKIPRRLRFVDRLPKGVTGKVQRQRLGGGADA
jgi:acyl-CoA synthetase (AMP-forming)/AMP-acid ligase II